MTPMDAAETIGRQPGQEVGQVLQRQNFVAIGQVQCEVVAGGRTMREFIELQAEGAGAGFDEQGSWGRGSGCCRGLLDGGFARRCFNDGATKPIIGYGLEQVIDRIEIEALECMLFVGGGEDDFALATHEPGNVKPVELWHLDVEQEKVRRVIAQVLQSVDGVGEGGGEGELGVLVDVGFQEFDGQRFVVDDDGFHGRYGGGWGGLSGSRG